MHELRNFIDASLGIRSQSCGYDSSNAIWDDGEWVPWSEINSHIEKNRLMPENEIEEEDMNPIQKCILVDYENVQSIDISKIDIQNCAIKVFVGNSQTKIAFDLVEKVQKFGDRGEWIRIEGTGPNALDFHIAFILGVLSSTCNKNTEFIIISKDTGFDPLIAFMKSKGLNCIRKSSPETKNIKPEKSVTVEKKAPQQLVQAQSNSKALLIIEKIKSIPKPRTEKTLKNAIKSLYKEMPDLEIEKTIKELVKLKFVVINQGKLQYPK